MLANFKNKEFPGKLTHLKVNCTMEDILVRKNQIKEINIVTLDYNIILFISLNFIA